MGTLHLSGLDQAALDTLQKNWKLKRGEPYNEEYLLYIPEGQLCADQWQRPVKDH